MGKFKTMAPTLAFGDAKLTMGAHAPKRWPINGVSVSVRPEIHLTTGGGNAPIRRGGIKLNISKGAVHSKEAADYVGTLMRHYLSDGLEPDECDHQLCHTLDVFGSKLVASPKATVNRMKDIESACGEIARQWPGITPDS